MQGQNFGFWTILVCCNIELWASGLLPEVKNNRKIQIVSVDLGGIQEVSTTVKLT